MQLSWSAFSSVDHFMNKENNKDTKNEFMTSGSKDKV